MMKISRLIPNDARAEFYPAVDVVIYQYKAEGKYYALSFWCGFQETAFWQCFFNKAQCESYM